MDFDSQKIKEIIIDLLKQNKIKKEDIFNNVSRKQETFFPVIANIYYKGDYSIADLMRIFRNIKNDQDLIDYIINFDDIDEDMQMENIKLIFKNDQLIIFF
jgi:hypothetical protein